MNLRHVFAIAQKDWIEVRQNKYALSAMLILPIMFVVILPLIFTVAIPRLNVDPQSVINSDRDIEIFIQSLPPMMKQYINWNEPYQAMIVAMLGYMLAPMFLMLPLMFSSTIASESFAGERERKTMEALLYTPATDMELFSGKILAAAVPAIGITWIAFAVYTLILNIAPWEYFQRVWFPLPTWWPLIFWVTPALVSLSIAFSVLISARVQTFMEAYQSSASIVLLVVLLFAGQMTGVLYLSVGVQMVLGAIIWALGIALTLMAVRGFQRTTLLKG